MVLWVLQNHNYICNFVFIFKKIMNFADDCLVATTMGLSCNMMLCSSSAPSCDILLVELECVGNHV